MITFSKFPKEQTQLIGHGQNFDQLWKLFEQQRLAPCWLLVGPEGGGKATFAYAFARKILAKNEHNPCGFQDTVVTHQTAIGSYPNLYCLEPTVDEDGIAAKEIRIDDVRKALVFLRQSPTIPGWRVVVVDSIDRLNRFAANALLKILEEPPQKTLILLVCHSLGKTLPTIRSRCQRLFFKPVEKADAALAFGESFDESLFSLCNGSVGLYAEMTKAGGQGFLDKITHGVEAAFNKNTSIYQRFSDDLAKNSLHASVLLKILPTILHQKAITHIHDKKYAYAYQDVFGFLSEAENAHLDPYQKLLSLFLVIERTL